MWPNMCTQPCPTNSTEMCGGAYFANVLGSGTGYTVLAAGPGTVAANTNTAYMGCYASPNNAANGINGIATYNFNSNLMTTELCLQACANQGANWGATEGGTNCYCGTTFNVGQGQFVGDDQCNVQCAGNSTEMCGQYYGASVYNLTAAGYKSVAPNKPAGYEGCFVNPGSNGLKSYSFIDNVMTPEHCQEGCYEMGYSLSGVDWGNTCFCGTTFTGGQQQPASVCVNQCAGNSSETCGGNYNIELYNTSAIATLVQAKIKAKPAGWSGCFDNSGPTILQNGYNGADSQLTVERCEATCKGLNFAWAGVQNGGSEWRPPLRQMAHAGTPLTLRLLLLERRPDEECQRGETTHVPVLEPMSGQLRRDLWWPVPACRSLQHGS